MKNFYVPNWERVVVESPQFVYGRYRMSWYKEFGFKVSFSNLEDNEIGKVLSKGFAPAISMNHGYVGSGDKAWTENYLYPTSFGDSDISF